MGKSTLYTRTGDRGTTSLVGGRRIRKDSTRLNAYGTIDEFSSHLGLLLALPLNTPEIGSILLAIQNKLFVIGSYLATDPTDAEKYSLADPVADSDINVVEQAIDSIDSTLPPMNSFILPGGTIESAQAHIARTVCRRAERCVLALDAEEPVDPRVIGYLNRLSDLLFAIARKYNQLAGVADTPWRPAPTL